MHSYSLCFWNTKIERSMKSIQYVANSKCERPSSESYRRYCVSLLLSSVPHSGHYVYRTVVTMCTTRLNIPQFHVLPTQCIYVFFYGPENKKRLFHCTALTGWLVFITEMECVYCAVRSTSYVLPAQCIYVFCVDLRTNSDYFTVQH